MHLPPVTMERAPSISASELSDEELALAGAPRLEPEAATIAVRPVSAPCHIVHKVHCSSMHQLRSLSIGTSAEASGGSVALQMSQLPCWAGLITGSMQVMEFCNVQRALALELLRLFNGSAAHVIDAGVHHCAPTCRAGKF